MGRQSGRPKRPKQTRRKQAAVQYEPARWPQIAHVVLQAIFGMLMLLKK